MRDKACIIRYENGIATVIPLLSDTCINCNSPTCAKRGTPFQASNPQNLKLKSGDIVKIEAPATTQIAQGFLSLIVPILSAIAGYFLAEPVAKPQANLPPSPQPQRQKTPSHRQQPNNTKQQHKRFSYLYCSNLSVYCKLNCKALVKL